jgi:hypothetical protein
VRRWVRKPYAPNGTGTGRGARGAICECVSITCLGRAGAKAQWHADRIGKGVRNALTSADPMARTLWSAGCAGTRTSGSGGGQGKRTDREAGTAPWARPHARHLVPARDTSTRPHPAPLARADRKPGTRPRSPTGLPRAVNGLIKRIKRIRLRDDQLRALAHPCTALRRPPQLGQPHHRPMTPLISEAPLFCHHT